MIPPPIPTSHFLRALRALGMSPPVRLLSRRDRLASEEVAEGRDDAGRGDPPLAAIVAVAERDGVVGRRLAVHGDAEGGPGLVLAAIAPADRPLLVEEDGEVPLQGAVERLGLLGHAVLLDQGKDRRLDRREPRVELQDRARLAADLVLGVRLAEEGQGRAVGAGRRLDDVRDISLLPLLVEVAEVLAAELLVLRQVIVSPVRDPLQLA